MPDWSATLWPASWSGVPFHVEREGHAGGRRLVKHEFPYRDLPFIEDLGELAREFPVTAYVASDGALAEAAAFEAALRRRGPGVLVLPGRGPVTARVLSFERTAERQALGYVGFEARFVAEGAASAVPSVTALASAVFAAVDALAAAAGGLVARLALSGLRGDVTVAAQDEAEGAVAALEALRASEALDTEASATLRDSLGALYADVPALVSRESGADAAFGERLVEAARDLSGAMANPLRAATVFGEAADAATAPEVPAGLTPSAAALAGNAALLARLGRAAWLAGYADALARARFPSRREGVTARAEASERFAAALADCRGGPDADLADALADLRGRVVALLSEAIADLRPVVTVTASARLPALWWAQRLYGSAELAEDLVARNRVRHAGFMPERFEALR